MVPEGAAAVSVKPMASSERKVTGRTNALWSDVPMLTQKTGQRLVTALLSWWPIYMCSPGHLKSVGVARSHTHTQEHLQAIQELIDHIIRF